MQLEEMMVVHYILCYIEHGQLKNTWYPSFNCVMWLILHLIGLHHLVKFH